MAICRQAAGSTNKHPYLPMLCLSNRIAQRSVISIEGKSITVHFVCAHCTHCTHTKTLSTVSGIFLVAGLKRRSEKRWFVRVFEPFRAHNKCNFERLLIELIQFCTHREKSEREYIEQTIYWSSIATWNTTWVPWNWTEQKLHEESPIEIEL